MGLDKKQIEEAKERIKRGLGEICEDKTASSKPFNRQHPQPRVYFDSKEYFINKATGIYKFKHHVQEAKFTIWKDKAKRIYVKFNGV